MGRFEDEYKKLMQERDKTEQMKLSLYPDWKNGDITRDEYLKLKEHFGQKLNQIDKRIGSVRNKIEEAENGQDSINPFLTQFIKYRNIVSLTREVVTELIEMIYVHEGGGITIKFRFSDARDAAKDYIAAHPVKKESA